ncbi:unnamed protein product [Sphagnum troendelagicum]|uniref:Peroxisomal ATPase PEX6 n=1 Tax=Sphagnum troendelagicum TaxID=128251 RepID=A0ABP0TTQ8_9BRYO
MGRRRKPLILLQTAEALRSVLGGDESSLHDGSEKRQPFELFVSSPAKENHSSVSLLPGLLFFPPAAAWKSSKERGEGQDQGRGGARNSIIIPTSNHFRVPSWDDEAATVGLSVSALRDLSLSSGSWVLVKNLTTNVGRPARAVALNPPNIVSSISNNFKESGDHGDIDKTTANSNFFPSYTLSLAQQAPMDPQFVYISPLLAFNIGLHVTWLQSIISSGVETREASMSASPNAVALEEESHFGTMKSECVEILPLHVALGQQLPMALGRQSSSESLEKSLEGLLQYASHVRIAHVRIPVIAKLHTEDDRSSSLSRSRQANIDVALQDYFKIDRVLAMGDLLAIPIKSNDPSIHYELAYFKVLALEPSTDPFLLVNCHQTALVLGGSVPALLPPSIMAVPPIQDDLPQPAAVYQVASLLAPCVHPGTPSLRLQTAVLIHGPSGCGKRTVVQRAAEELGLHVVEYNCYDFLGASDGKTAAAVSNAFKTARKYSPAVLLLRRFGGLAKSLANDGLSSDHPGVMSQVASALREGSIDSRGVSDVFTLMGLQGKFAVKNRGPRPGLVLLVAAAEGTEGLTPQLRRCFTHEVTLEAPDEEQRLLLLHHFLGLKKEQEEGLQAYLKSISSQMSGLTPRDLRAFAADAGAFAVSRVMKENGDSLEDEDPCAEEQEDEESLLVEDLEKALECMKVRTASSIGTPKVPNVKWEDVGGLEDVKKAILDTVQLPLVHRELFASGLRQRSGVLLYGPPGTGKTLLAKAVATECSLNFLSVKGPELINMYIGESEKNVREIFHKARAARPCVVFFDELDALAPARGASGDSGGVMDRVVSQMLAEIDGLNDKSQDLFIIGASNRPDLIDPALLRPGRFDKLLYVGVSSDVTYRERVLAALTRKFTLDKNVSLVGIARRCPVNFTGADMYALCADAWLQATKRKVAQRDKFTGSSDIKEADDNIVVVKQDDFFKALGELTPSLSRAELDRYERLRIQFEGQGTRSTSSSA